NLAHRERACGAASLALRRSSRQLVPGTTIQVSVQPRPQPVALLIEEGHAGRGGAIAQIADPSQVQWPVPRTAFAADDDPIKPREFEVRQRAQQRLAAEESYG